MVLFQVAAAGSRGPDESPVSGGLGDHRSTPPPATDALSRIMKAVEEMKEDLKSIKIFLNPPTYSPPRHGMFTNKLAKCLIRSFDYSLSHQREDCGTAVTQTI